jgi:tetratricopeptide (TPR) repeat protein
VWRWHVPWIAVTVVVVAARLVIFARLEHPHDLLLDWRSGLAELDVLRRYLALLVVPAGQSIFHAVEPVQHLYDLAVWRGAATLACLVGVVWWLRRAEPLAAFGVAWFLLLMAPSSALVALGQGEGMAEHRVYLASAGLFVAIGAVAGQVAAWSRASPRYLRVLLAAAPIACVLSLSARTVLRNVIWSSPVSLWQEAVDRAPDNWFPRTVLGESLHLEGRHAEAAAQYRAALVLHPADDMSYIKLSFCLAELGRFDEARAALEDLRRIDPASTSVTTGLGIVAVMSGRADEAKTLLGRTLDRNPSDVMALQWLAAIAELVDNDPAAALRLCEQIQTIVPGDLGNDDCIRRNRARVTAGG